MLTKTSAVALLAAAPLSVFSADTPAARIKITYPITNQTVPGEVIELTGTGADPQGTLKVEVLTNQWWLQKGEWTINPDGSWSYGPCYLSGQGEFNNHTIRVTVIKNGKIGNSDRVTGVRRAG